MCSLVGVCNCWLLGRWLERSCCALAPCIVSDGRGILVIELIVLGCKGAFRGILARLANLRGNWQILLPI